MDRGCLCGHVPFVSIHDTNLLIKDIFSDGVWHLEKLVTQLPMDIQLELHSVFTDDYADDLLIWGASNSSEYSAKTAYHWLMNDRDSVSPSLESWAWVWR